MIYRGHVKNGVVVLDDTASLPEGASVRIDVDPDEPNTAVEEQSSTLYDRLKSVAGIAKGLPSDFAENHDHYLHGQPKK